MEESFPFLRNFFFKRWNKKRSANNGLDEETLREYEASNKAILQEIEVSIHSVLIIILCEHLISLNI